MRFVDQFATPCAGRIQRHEHGPVGWIGGAVDQPHHFFRTEDDGQAAALFRKGNFVRQIRRLSVFT
jgi:hypothetical protein